MYIKAGTGFCRQLVVPNDSHVGKTAVEILHVSLQSSPLFRCPGVPGSFPVTLYTADVHNVPGCPVIPFCPIGNLPRIDHVILVVCHQPFHRPVQMDHVGITDLLPAAASFIWRGCVPTTDLFRRYFTACRGGGAVDNQEFQGVRHGIRI